MLVALAVLTADLGALRLLQGYRRPESARVAHGLAVLWKVRFRHVPLRTFPGAGLSGLGRRGRGRRAAATGRTARRGNRDRLAGRSAVAGGFRGLDGPGAGARRVPQSCGRGRGGGAVVNLAGFAAIIAVARMAAFFRAAPWKQAAASRPRPAEAAGAPDAVADGPDNVSRVFALTGGLAALGCYSPRRGIPEGCGSARPRPSTPGRWPHARALFGRARMCCRRYRPRTAGLELDAFRGVPAAALLRQMGAFDEGRISGSSQPPRSEDEQKSGPRKSRPCINAQVEKT